MHIEIVHFIIYINNSHQTGYHGVGGEEYLTFKVKIQNCIGQQDEQENVQVIDSCSDQAKI